MKKMLLFPVLAFVGLGGVATVAANEIAVTVFARGQVEATSLANENLAPRDLMRKSLVFVDERITTGKDARAKFNFNEGTLLTLGENAEINIVDFDYMSKEPSAVFEYVTGAFRFVTGAITKTEKPNFVVKTGMGTIGIRGTDFWVGSLVAPDACEILLLESEHSIVISTAKGDVVLDEKGEGVTLYPDKPIPAPKIWPQEKVARAIAMVEVDE